MPERATSQQIAQRLHDLYERQLPLEEGAVAAYYESGREYYEPQLAGDAASTFGIALADLDGELFCAGDHDEPFALHSISKVFVYGLALEDRGRDYVLSRVGVEPSGDPFNSIVLDDRNHRPHNPMVNAGALVATDLVHGNSPEEKLERILERMRLLAGNDSLEVDWDLFELELQSADRNRATAYLMRSQGMLEGDVEATLALYLQQCSIKVTCCDLAVMAATLANGSVNPLTGKSVLAREHVRDVLTVMYTCGMYDFAGQWAFEIGVPAKSGVSGGILAAIPGKLGIGVFSPGLDTHGNSVRGIRVCEEVSQHLGLHLFATDDEDALLRSQPSAR